MPPNSSPVPYWRLSSFYFFYFAALGALIPYWGLYLKSLGFTHLEIGEMFAILGGTKIIAPYVWGWLADRGAPRIGIVRSGSFAALLAFTGVYLVSGYWWMAVVIALFSFFWNAALPQFEAATLSHLGDEHHRYSKIRLWGSIGFIVTAFSLGPLMQRYGSGILVHALTALFAGIWLASLFVPESVVGTRRQRPLRISTILKQPAVIALLMISFLMQAGHAPYYAFFSIYLQTYGYSKSTIGMLWALGVVAEILVFLYMHRALPRFGARYLIITSLLLTIIRWVLTALFVESLVVIALAQTLHAASFGIFHAASIHLIHRFFSGRAQGRGQALYSGISFGAGGALGSVASGYAWTLYNGSVVYIFSAIVTAIALIIACAGLREPGSGLLEKTP